MKKTIILMIGLSLILNAEFIRNDVKDIVIDTKTGLQWQDYLHPIRKFEEAVDYCHNLNHGGYSDWRLPNINEYITLNDYNTHDPAVSREFAYIYSDADYMSSTKYANDSDLKWFYQSKSGTAYIIKTYHFNSYYFFCVRGG